MTKGFVLGAAMAMALGAGTAATGAGAQTATASPEKIALAQQIFQLQGGVKTVQAMLDSVETAVSAQVLKNLPPERQAQTAEMQAASREAMANFVPKLVDWEVSFFAVNYSEQELTQILAFYQSPTGQDVISKTPLLAQQLGPFMASQLPLIRTGTVDRYCAKTSCTPAMRLAMLSPPAALR